MSTIEISDLCFAYDGQEPLFSHVHLQIDLSWKLGLIGRNGRGKTTLMKLLAGMLEPEGRIRSPVPMCYFPYSVEPTGGTTRQLISELPCYRANSLESLEFESWRLERELSLLDVPEEVLDRPFETLSPGEQTKVLLAALFMEEDRFFLLDEPTNHLDVEARSRLAGYLRSKSGFILVSHDRTLLDGAVDHVLSINRTDISLIRGDYSAWQREQDYHRRFEESQKNRLQKDIRRLQDASTRSSEWSKRAEKGKYGNGPVDRGFIGAKAAKMMKQAQSTQARKEKAAEQKRELFKNTESDETLSLSPLRFHSNRLIALDHVSLSYNERNVFHDLSFQLEAGERVALSGRNGSGKSSLLKWIAGPTISGAKIPCQGRRAVPESLKISYIPQDASALAGPLREWIKQREIDESLFKAILAKMGFSREDYETDMADYSEGQKKKTFLAASLCDRAHLYLWDEPLNFIDIISRMQIEELILKHKPTLIFIEHDQTFQDSIATRKFVVTSD